jgi:hypothetical protein
MGRNPYDVNVDEFCQIPVDGIPTDIVGMSLSLQGERSREIEQKVYIEGWVDVRPAPNDPEGENGNIPQKLHMVILMDQSTASDLVNALILLLTPPVT